MWGDRQYGGVGHGGKEESIMFKTTEGKIFLKWIENVPKMTSYGMQPGYRDPDDSDKQLLDLEIELNGEIAQSLFKKHGILIRVHL
jgi:hypothetical protein